MQAFMCMGVPTNTHTRLHHHHTHTHTPKSPLRVPLTHTHTTTTTTTTTTNHTQAEIITEYRAKRALARLQQSAPHAAAVLRDGGREVEVPAKEVVPGDVVVLRAGMVGLWVLGCV
jgi:magnesium-transporting ATPase (P-type)